MQLPQSAPVRNPFRPGAGHTPPYLAGRNAELSAFGKLLNQDKIIENLVLTGPRGIGKTVLLDSFKQLAIESGWLWAGADIPETIQIAEESVAKRLLVDLAVAASSVAPAEPAGATLHYPTLHRIYESAPGLVSDKIKTVLESAWPHLEKAGTRGIVFAYDEAQNLAGQTALRQNPLSLLLDVFQSLQWKGIRMMLVLAGLPTLTPKLVEARAFAEGMFQTIFLNPLTESETAEAIKRPIEADPNCPLKAGPGSIKYIWNVTRGYPYFVQCVCRESYDVLVQAIRWGRPLRSIPIREILRKLDSDYFAGHWVRATDRQRAVLEIAAQIPGAPTEFTVLEIVESPLNRNLAKPFSASHANQLLASLAHAGLVYKTRHGRYSFAVPLLGEFILRQLKPGESASLFPMPPLRPGTLQQ